VPLPVGGGLGSHPTPFTYSNTETDGQQNTRDRSSGQSGALLQISYFKGEFTVHNILQYYFGTWEDNK
jgi:hypothetical protein